MSDDQENPLAGSEPDPELVALAGTGERPSLLRPILMIAVIVMAGWIISDWTSELEYFMSDSTPVDLGEGTDYAVDPADPTAKPDLPHNRFVKIRGIPTQRSQSARYRFFRLVGAPVFVEQERDDYIEDPLERELAGNKGDVDRTYYEGTGRIIKFAEVPGRYGGLRHYYRSRYNVAFCDELTASDREEIVKRKRDAIRAQWKLEYEESTDEERQRADMGPEPTDPQLEALLALDPPCIEAWLIQDGTTPRDHWWYLAAALLFAAFMVFNLVMLVRWVIAFARS